MSTNDHLHHRHGDDVHVCNALYHTYIHGHLRNVLIYHHILIYLNYGHRS